MRGRNYGRVTPCARYGRTRLLYERDIALQASRLVATREASMDDQPVLLSGIDFCTRPTSPEHVAQCPVHLRRERMFLAELSDWPALGHDIARAQLPYWAARFSAPPDAADAPSYQGFYAHLAEC